MKIYGNGWQYSELVFATGLHCKYMHSTKTMIEKQIS
jgi:hypothetical protein